MKILDELLACVVCGYKQGGTTLFSSLIAADSQFSGRFETGLLQVKKPKDILGARGNVLKNLTRSWNISSDLLEEMASQNNFYDAYRLLLEENGFPKGQKLIDKYPDYIRFVDDIVSATDAPIIFVARDPRALYWSRLKRLKDTSVTIYEEENVETKNHGVLTPERFATEYVKLFRRAKEYEAKYAGQFHIFKLEKMLVQTAMERDRLFKLLNRQTPDKLFGDIGVSDQKVRSGFDLSVIEDFRENLTNDEQEEILLRCDEASELFLNVS